jgi:hypothetical protein
VDAICQAIGLKVADLFPVHHGNGSATHGRKIVARYDYKDDAGKLLYQVVRYQPKGFSQRRPNPKIKGGWIWNLNGTKKVLYRLPELRRAVPAGEPVYIVEGEKDANRLAKLGIVATTNAGGAGKWRSEYSTELNGAAVIILPDNDESGQLHAHKVAHSLWEKAASIKILNLPGLPPKGDVSDWLDAGGTREKLLELVDAAQPWNPSEGPSEELSGPATKTDVRPEIIITTDEHEVNQLAVAALVRDEGIYQRGGLLVRIVRDASPAAKGIRRPFSPRIEPLPNAILRERLAANVRWIVRKWKEDGFQDKRDHPPAWCVAALHARAEWPGIRHLEAVVEYPILRADGTILSTPGYDADTGLLLEPAGEFPPMPDNPAREDAVASLNALLEVVADFPFEKDVHRAAWLAGLLTPLARFAFKGPAPLFLVDANVRAAGKGLLLDCISRIITGERFTIATYTSDEDELRKRITSLVLGGDRLVLFDNLEGKFGNAVLDAALTGVAWKDRVLGVNRMAEGPLLMTWYATGNNVAVAADTARRVCHIRLESPEERPEERNNFRHPDLLSWVGENRQKLLTAALTILRAYCLAGRPDVGLQAWGSFEGWTGLVRSAVVWIGLPDPGETRLLLRERADTTSESMAILLECWERMDPNRQGRTAAQVIDFLYKPPPESPPDFFPDMKTALENLLEKPDSRLLGNCLRRHRRRIFKGRFIDQAGKEHQAARWVVYPSSEFHERPNQTPQTPDTPSELVSAGPQWECRESGESISVNDGFHLGRIDPEADAEWKA